MKNGVIALSGAVAGTLLIIMMMVTVVDVFGRYFLNAPLRGSFEITQFLMAAIVYAGLPNVTLRESHIVIDLLDGITPAHVILWRELLINIVCCLAFSVVAWQLWHLAEDVRDWGDTTQYLRWPRYPIVYFGSFFCAVAATIHLGKVFAAGRRALH